ncbi:G-protein coupled receptor 126 [Liparis tanakae]|uniref:G-protein coupled receptor 126 n=1 Tax=Liparis tanakae TaxID=230148 RepID=A0A4Z2F0C6_9TELE|nr:G-protein coupled receptor 126 [Liparis tanakae]
MADEQEHGRRERERGERRGHAREWLFSYVALGGAEALSLGSDGSGMKLMVDGVVCPISSILSSAHFPSSMRPYCVLWTSSSGRVGVFFNGNYWAETCSSSSGRSVPPGGQFRLGGSHSFNGNIYNLRLWDYAMTAPQLAALGCGAVGNVIDWDNGHWSVPNGSARTDTGLSCTRASAAAGVTPPRPAGPATRSRRRRAVGSSTAPRAAAAAGLAPPPLGKASLVAGGAAPPTRGPGPRDSTPGLLGPAEPSRPRPAAPLPRPRGHSSSKTSLGFISTPLVWQGRRRPTGGRSTASPRTPRPPRPPRTPRIPLPITKPDPPDLQRARRTQTTVSSEETATSSPDPEAALSLPSQGPPAPQRRGGASGAKELSSSSSSSSVPSNRKNKHVSNWTGPPGPPGTPGTPGPPGTPGDEDSSGVPEEDGASTPDPGPWTSSSHTFAFPLDSHRSSSTSSTLLPQSSLFLASSEPGGDVGVSFQPSWSSPPSGSSPPFGSSPPSDVPSPSPHPPLPRHLDNRSPSSSPDPPLLPPFIWPSLSLAATLTPPFLHLPPISPASSLLPPPPLSAPIGSLWPSWPAVGLQQLATSLRPSSGPPTSLPLQRASPLPAGEAGLPEVFVSEGRDALAPPPGGSRVWASSGRADLVPTVTSPPPRPTPSSAPASAPPTVSPGGGSTSEEPVRGSGHLSAAGLQDSASETTGATEADRAEDASAEASRGAAAGRAQTPRLTVAPGAGGATATPSLRPGGNQHSGGALSPEPPGPRSTETPLPAGVSAGRRRSTVRPAPGPPAGAPAPCPCKPGSPAPCQCGRSAGNSTSHREQRL